MVLVLTTQDMLLELDGQLSASAKRHHLSVSPEARAYAIGVLGDYLRSDNHPFDTVTESQARCAGPASFKQLGDYCLFLFGYFYERSRERGFSELHRHVGSSSYQRYSTFLHSHGFRDSLFDELSQRFDDFAILIGDLRLEQITDQHLLELYSRHLRNPSERYKALLEAKGILFPESSGDA